MLTYKLLPHGAILRSDGASFGSESEGLLADEYKLWLLDGNTPYPADPVSPNVAILEQILTLENSITTRTWIELQSAPAVVNPKPG